MNVRIIFIAISLSVLMASCYKEFDCMDAHFNPVFVHVQREDYDTLVLRKYEPHTNYQTLIDTVLLITDVNVYPNTYGDTTNINTPEVGITPGFDWQLFMPSKNKTIAISDIVSGRDSRKSATGIFRIFALDPGPPCLNPIYSCKVDGVALSFTNERYMFYIQN